MLTDLLRHKEQNSRLMYFGKLAYVCLLLFLFVAIITLVFGVFEAKMSFVTIFGEDNWKPIDACSSGVESILFNTWTVLSNRCVSMRYTSSVMRFQIDIYKNAKKNPNSCYSNVQSFNSMSFGTTTQSEKSDCAWQLSNPDLFLQSFKIML